MEKNKIFLSDEVINFLSNFNCIKTHSRNKDGETYGVVYFIDTIFKETESTNIFEIITKDELITNFCRENEMRYE